MTIACNEMTSVIQMLRVSTLSQLKVDKSQMVNKIRHSLVTQPMLQRQPNRTELRSMDSYIQILFRFQKCKQKVPPPSLLSTKK